jgi:hypothetical protein
MKKFLLLLILIISASFIVASNFTSYRIFKKLPLDRLYSEKVQYEKSVADLQAKMKSDGATDELTRNIIENTNNIRSIEIEIVLKKYFADPIALIALLLSALSMLFIKYKKSLTPEEKSVDSIISEIEITEDPPREIYVDEWEYHKKSEGGFTTKREAIDWVKSDPSLKCDYCGSRLRSTMTGKKEAVQLITFYKKVPEGAKDLRVVLGTFWFTKAATELKCPSCDRLVKR